jgi:ubiquinone/menaquinone biosynthesis C-methylase UbiE
VEIRRLNWGCGRRGEPGWINSDRRSGERIDISCDIRDGLPIDSESIDYAVSSHALQEVPLAELIAVLRELRRVLKPGGVLRLCLPDLDKGLQAYLRNDRSHFLIPDEDVTSLGGKFITHMLWYGYSRTLFTADFIEELLLKAGFQSVASCGYKETKSKYAGIVELDSREHESLFVEALRE